MRLLFVDGDNKAGEELRVSLAKFNDGWDLVFVATATEALAELSQEFFQAVITEQHLKDMSGRELLARVADEHPNTLRVVLSAKPQEPVSSADSDLAQLFLLKPCFAEELLKTIFRSSSLHCLIRRDDLAELVSKIGELPPPPKVYNQLVMAFSDPDVGLMEVNDIVEEAPEIGQQLLKLANSPRFPMRNRATTVQQAINFMGGQMVASFVLSLEVAAAFPVPEGSEFCTQHHSNHSLTVAVLAREIFDDDRKMGIEAFAAGMMHDFGKLVMASRFADHSDLIDSPGSKLTHGLLGAHLLAEWGFGLPVIQGVAYHHCPAKTEDVLGIATALHIADAIAHELEGEVELAEELLDLEHLAAIGAKEVLAQRRKSAAALV